MLSWVWVGGWVGGCGWGGGGEEETVGGWVDEYSEMKWVGGWVGGWVDEYVGG